MMRKIGVAVAVALLVLGFVAFQWPQLFPEGVGERLPRIIYLVLFLLLATGAAWGFQRLRGTNWLGLLLVWAALIAGIAFAYTLFN